METCPAIGKCCPSRVTTVPVTLSPDCSNVRSTLVQSPRHGLRVRPPCQVPRSDAATGWLGDSWQALTNVANRTRAVARLRLPNGRRVSGERRAEGDERVRCTRVLGRLFSHCRLTSLPIPRARHRRCAERMSTSALRGLGPYTPALRTAYRMAGSQCGRRIALRGGSACRRHQR